MWGQDEKNSFLLFREAMSCRECMIWNFSVRQSLHVLELGLKVLAVARNCYLMAKSSPSSFSLQMWPASLVLIRLPEWRNVSVWLL